MPVRNGHPWCGEGRRSCQRRTTGAHRKGTHTSSSSTSLCRILPRLLRKPASASRQIHAMAKAARRPWAEPRATTAATVPTTCRPAMTASGGIPPSQERNHTGRNSADG